MKNFFILILSCFILAIPVLADENEEWNITDEYVQSLFESGKLSEEAYNLYKDGVDISDTLKSIEGNGSFSSSDLDSGNSNLLSKELEESKALANESGSNLLSLSSVPGSGSAYSDPVLIQVEYAPDAEQGSLLSVLYGLLGKPVQAYHYRWQSSTQGYNVYSCQVLDYDINWISSVVLLLLVIFCIFKAGGALLSKR